jgi:hypothetical protein
LDHDVGLPGADGARTGVARDKVAEGIREATVDAVTHYHPRSGLYGREKAGGRRWGLTHQFILGGPARFAGMGREIIGSDVRVRPVAGCKCRRDAGTNVERPGT